ncbi:snf2 family, putative [Ichthyophthirius multifiliis]|uniref:Snf2 family, putative n=1 Tax=Ichthyophthirius multifiliis TaxID=5932 RepID=G0R0P3_ICHMU|nr:snf2 family, putative [Ichthyophthirius multifiliis]EGR28958.1 snf2 family, putative [Ichthyophthirius multifiliis]|eukprot:XP_004030194.1 snf2 family, putative [Ichthyophthirius multifiliis]
MNNQFKQQCQLIEEEVIPQKTRSLRRSNRQTKNTKPVLDDFQYKSEEEDEEEFQQEQIYQTRYTSNANKIKQAPKQKQNKQQNNKKAKNNKDDEDFQIESQEESSSYSQEEHQKFQPESSSESMHIFNDNSQNNENNFENDYSEESSHNANTFRQYFSLRSVEQILKEQVKLKQERKKKKNEGVNQNEITEEKTKINNNNKRTRKEFEKQNKIVNLFNVPQLKINQWPKYIGSIQIKAKIQFEIHNYMRKVEFIKMKQWAVSVAQNLEKGQSLEVDFRPIDENRNTNLTLGLRASKMHTNISLNQQTFGIFEHNFCEVWNLLAHKNYITIDAFCLNPYESSNVLDQSKAFDVMLDVYLNQDFVKNPILLVSKHEELDEKVEKEEQEEEKAKSKQKRTKQDMTTQQIQQHWDMDYIRYMKEVIPLFISLMKLNITISPLIQLKKKNQFELIKFLALKRAHSTLPPTFVLKNEKMRDYYSKSAPEVLQNAIPLYLYDNLEALSDMDFEYGDMNENTRVSLGLVKEEEKIKDEEMIKLNEQFVNCNQSKYFILTETPKTMSCQLFDYQKQGLSWLIYREGKISKKELYALHIEKYEEDRELNPFFQEVELPDGYKFYHNVFSGYICENFVKAKHTYGGILADQMGLGKTLMSLALIHHDIKNQRNFQKKNKKNAGTLIVMPLTIENIQHGQEDSNDQNDEALMKYNFNNPNNISGSKVIEILKIIEQIHKKNEKVVVFTQWIGMINILDHQLYTKKIPYERLDGTIKISEKERISRKFENNENNNNQTTVLLASIKTASLGLNLVAANNVILCDPWWNPSVEDQAIERVHRIGQKKEVFVWRIICENTIEEKVIELHDKKKQMIQKALSSNEFQRKEDAMHDLEFLLN